MINELGKELSKYGFSSKEAKTYTSLLASGRLQVSELARQTKLPRTSLYLPLEELEKHGFVTKVRIGNRHFWEANSPKSIVRHTKENLSGLQTLLPDLENLAVSQKQTGTPELLFYKNREGITQVNKMVLGLKSSERMYAIQGSRTIKFQKQKISTREIIGWQTAFRKSNIIGEVIIGDDSLELMKDIETQALEAHLDRKVIAYLLPKHLMDFDASIYVFRDTVAIMTFEKDLTIIITNKEIAQVFMNLIKIATSFGRKIDFNAEIAKIINPAPHTTF